MARPGIHIDTRIDVRGHSTGGAARLLIDLITDSGEYRIAAVGPNRYELARSYRPGWVIPVGVLTALPTLGLGLLVLLIKRHESCTAQVVEDRSGVHVRLRGTLLEGLSADLQRVLGAVVDEAPPRMSPSASGVPPRVPPVVPSSASGVPPRVPPVAPSSASGVPPRVPPVAPSSASGVPPVVPSAGTPAVPIASIVADVTPTPAWSLAGVVANTEDTVMRPRPHGPASGDASRPALQFSTGRRVELTSGAVIGRDPVPDAEDAAGAETIAIADLAMSKTHVSFRRSPAGLELRDRHSTNGTNLLIGGVPQACEPGSWTPVPVGAVVLFGDQHVEVVA